MFLDNNNNNRKNKCNYDMMEYTHDVVCGAIRIIYLANSYMKVFCPHDTQTNSHLGPSKQNKQNAQHRHNFELCDIFKWKNTFVLKGYFQNLESTEMGNDDTQSRLCFFDASTFDYRIYSR